MIECLPIRRMYQNFAMEFGFSLLVPFVLHLYQYLKYFWLNVVEILTLTLSKATIRNKSHFGLGNDERGKTWKDIPGPLAVPFFGTTLSAYADNADLKQANAEFVRKYGPLVKLEHFWNFPIILVMDPNDIDKVLKGASLYRPEMGLVVAYRKSRPDRYDLVGIVNSQLDDSKKFRLAISELTKSTYISNFMTASNEIMTDGVNLIRSLGSQIDKFDDIILRIAAEHSTKLILNKRIGFLDMNSQKMDVFINGTHGYWKALQVSMHGFPTWKYFPTQLWKDFSKFEDGIYDTFHEIVEEETKNKKAEGLLKTILESDLTKRDQRTLAMDLVLAGMEPNMNSALLLLYWISRHPDVDAKLFAELKSVFPDKHDKTFEVSSLSQIPYLDACTKEAFRLSPTTPNLARVRDTDILLQGYHIPAHTLFIVQTWHACLQEENFYRATEFIPERWLSSGPNGVRNPEFNPHRSGLCLQFGLGKRECPGRKFAIQQLNVLTAKLLRNFKFTFPEEIGLKYVFLQSPNLPLAVQVEERPE